MEEIYKDMDGKKIDDGHLLVVRYAWNSYVGIMRNMCRLSLWEGAKRHAGAAPYHEFDPEYTYQIIGHENPQHPDFNPLTFDWWTSEESDYNCPIKIRVYETV